MFFLLYILICNVREFFSFPHTIFATESLQIPSVKESISNFPSNKLQSSYDWIVHNKGMNIKRKSRQHGNSHFPGLAVLLVHSSCRSQRQLGSVSPEEERLENPIRETQSGEALNCLFMPLLQHHIGGSSSRCTRR